MMSQSPISQNSSSLFSIENDACWQCLISQNILGIAQVSLKGKWLSGNKKICDILGYSWEELRQMKVEYITYPDDFYPPIEQLNKLKDTEEFNFSFEKRYIRKDRTIIWIKQTVSAIKNDHGTIKAYLLILEDITEQKIFEYNLIESREKFDQVLDSVKQLLAKYQQAKDELIDRANYAKLGGDIGFALTQSKTLEELLNCCSEAITLHLNINAVYIWIVNYQDNLPQLILKSVSYKNPDNQQKLKDILDYFNIHSILETGRPCLIENLLYLPKNDQFSKRDNLISFIGYPLKIEEKIVGVIGFLANHSFSQNTLDAISGITDQIAIGIQHKQNEVILQQERQHLQQIVTYAPVAIAMFDRQMNYLAYSQQWLIDYDLENQDLRGKNYYEIMPDLPQHWQEIHQKVLQGNIEANNENIWPRANGKNLFLRWAMHPWYHLDHSVGGIIMASQVINELVEAREKALELVRVKSRFFTTMSHDIRTPMNGVLGMTDLLLKTPLNREQNDFVETLKTSGQNLLSIINDLLDFSKLEAGEMSLNIQVFDLQETLENVIEMLSSQSNCKGIELLLLIAPNVPLFLQGDRNRLQQILINLTGNALKFTERGAVTIQVSLVKEKDTEVTLKFMVKDTGIGIALEDQNKLFLSFSQVGEAQRGKYGGTGLGLSICKQLTDLMQGEIGVESEIDQGSNFWFILPFKKQLNPEVLSLSEISPLNGSKLLLIDHSLSYQMIYSYAENWQMEWYQAPTLATAIQSIHQEINTKHPYDIALVDLQSTKIDPRQLNKIITMDPLLQKIHWLFLISNNQIQELQPLLNQEIDGYLLKPLRVSHLFDTFMNLLSNNNSNLKHSEIKIDQSLRHNYHILLVEDTPTNQKVITYQLQLLGYQVKCVNNGQEALNELAQTSYDLVLMDCLMPILNGYETTIKVRQEEGKSRHTIIIAMTAHAFDQDRQKCLEVGMDDYISKPVTIETLEAILSRWLPQKTDFTLKIKEDQPQIFLENNELIDFQRLNELTRDDIEFQKQVISTFVEDAFEYINQIEYYINQKMPRKVAHYAHQLKGASSMTGIYHLPQMAKNLEIIANEKSENLPQYLFLIPQMQTILEKLKTLLEQI